MADTIEAQADETRAQVTDTVALAADIVAAYISNNSLPAADLPGLLAKVHQAVSGLASGGVPTAAAADQPEETQKATPGQVRKSITPDGLISFIDGKAYKTLKRHLGTHGLDPHGYRARYGLPSDYPMVAPNYAAQRSALAKSIGLGRPGRAAEPVGKSAASAAPARKPRVRKAA